MWSTGSLVPYEVGGGRRQLKGLGLDRLGEAAAPLSPALNLGVDTQEMRHSSVVEHVCKKPILEEQPPSLNCLISSLACFKKSEKRLPFLMRASLV